MTIPVWALLGFAAWTLFILVVPVGLYRWGNILSGRAAVAGWRPDGQDGSAWYERAVRAHLNCVENLPVYTAIVVTALASHTASPLLDILAVVVLAARICQSSIHMLLEQTNRVVAFRFSFFFVQALAMIAMGTVIAMSTFE